MSDSAPLHVCAFHPKAEANVRCTSCDRYVCVDCMIDAPVGFKCPECVRGGMPERFNSLPAHQAACAAAAAAVAFFGGVVLKAAPAPLFLAALAHYLLGLAAGELAQRTVKKSGRKIKIAAGVGIAAGLLAVHYRTLLLGAFLGAPAFHILLASAFLIAAVYGGMSRILS